MLVGAPRDAPPRPDRSAVAVRYELASMAVETASQIIVILIAWEERMFYSAVIRIFRHASPARGYIAVGALSRAFI